MFWKKGLLIALLFCGFSICMNVFMVYSGKGFSLDVLHPPIQVIHPSPIESLPEGPYTYLGKGKIGSAFPHQACIIMQ